MSNTTALNNFSYELKSGRTAALLGNNGSGKSTAVKCLVGSIHPTEGSVSLKGNAPSTPKSRQDVGYLPERFGIFPGATVKQLLRALYDYKQLPPSDRNDQIEYLRNVLNLSDVMETPFGQCSHGQQRRVGLAQALLGQPSLLLLDEPTTGLDPQTQERFYQLVRERTDDDQTTLLITHRMDEVKQLCEQAVLLEQGEIKTKGNTDEIIASFKQ